MEATLRNLPLPEWIPVLLVASLILSATAKLTNGQRFSEFVILPFTDKYFMVTGKLGVLLSGFNLLLFGVQTISVSLTMYYALNIFSANPNFYNHFLFIRVFGLYTSFVTVKFCVEKVVGHLFLIEKEIDEYLYYKLTHKNWVGLFLVPVNFLMYTMHVNTIVFIVFVAIAVLVNLFLLMHYYREKRKYIINNFFYFILYLCTLEISSYYLLCQLIVVD